MEYIQNIHVTSVTKKDLVNLFSTATYNNPDMGIEVSRDSLDIKARVTTEEDCLEDVWAKVLLEPLGHLDILVPDEATYGEKGKNWIKAEFEIHEGWINDYPITRYKIGLQNLLDGLNRPEAVEYVNELFIKDEGDLYTAYNLMQIILFNEVIYG